MVINLIGQERLKARLASYTIDTFPRSVMLVGEKGSGKHLLVNMIKDTIINLPLVDITTTISDEYLDQIYRNPNPSIYLIDISEITEKAQNTLLKFVEEPSNNAFIIIIAEHRGLVLNTVLNRCIVFDMDKYSKDELKAFVPEGANADVITEILRTPGKLLATNLKTFSEAQELCDKIINKMSVASYPNALSIASKVNYKDEYDKIDVESLLDLLCFSLLSAYKDRNDINILNMYYLTRDHRKSLLDKRVNKQLLFENYLSKLWLMSRGR